ncbi:hypothetical protein [Catellatospora tritici]|uniref:hypothetical protein n=1 Tax=Catellatospora tritici TaxID=2851566 RepID=UPI001C2D78C3|nr:hypothetical protein [Catellatospora tritici]MBV1850291.1 hypothetical protein [Catellatospora tritici]
MTPTELGQIFDDATADLPPGVALPPLDAIHGRVRRRRAGLVSAVAAVAVLAVIGVAVPLLGPSRHDRPQPALQPPRIGWQFGMVDGTKLSIFATALGDCTVLRDARTELGTSGDSLTISLYGTPARGEDCMETGFQQVNVELPERFAGGLIRDGADEQLRPVYDRAELPPGFRGGAVPSFSWGVERRDRGPVEFTGQFQLQESVTEPHGIVQIGFKGMGLVRIPLDNSVGEPVTLGSTAGWLVRDERDGYRFVWQRPRGDAAGLWIGYEIGYRGSPTKGPVYTRSELLDSLRSLGWAMTSA